LCVEAVILSFYSYLRKDTDCVTQRMELHHVMGGRNGISPFLNLLALKEHCAVPRLGIACSVKCVDPRYRRTPYKK
jgi:hypothetical protein